MSSASSEREPSRRELQLRQRAIRRRRARIRRHRLVALTWLVVIVLGLSTIAGVFKSPAPGRATSVAALSRIAGPSFVAPGHLSTFAWPSIGEASVGLQGAGVVSSSPKQKVVPIASMTKMMTAQIILHDHPLQLGEQGPMVRVTSADVDEYTFDSSHGNTNVPVKSGERLSEYQLLEALLMSSGDNIADILARWDARTVPKFIVKMNAKVRSLNLSHTHYADASGVSSGSQSTPAEQVIVASKLMESAVARKIVSQLSISFPVAGKIPNYNPALGVDGIIGVKSGFTSAALGCLATAVMRTVQGKRVMLIAVSTGNIYGLYGAARVDEQLLKQLGTNLVAVKPSHAQQELRIVLPGSKTPSTLQSEGAPPTLVAWRGAKIRSHVLIVPHRGSSTGSVVTKLLYESPTGILGVMKLTSSPAPGSAT